MLTDFNMSCRSLFTKVSLTMWTLVIGVFGTSIHQTRLVLSPYQACICLVLILVILLLMLSIILRSLSRTTWSIVWSAGVSSFIVLLINLSSLLLLETYLFVSVIASILVIFQIGKAHHRPGLLEHMWMLIFLRRLGLVFSLCFHIIEKLISILNWTCHQLLWLVLFIDRKHFYSIDSIFTVIFLAFQSLTQ